MGGGGGGSGGGGGGGRVGSGTGNLRGPGETNRQRFNRQVNSRIKSRNRGPNAAQAAFQAGYRGWSVGQSGSWSGGNIGDANSPAAKAYKSKHGESAYKSMVKSKGYKGTTSKSWSSIAFGDRPENEWTKIQNEFYSPLSDFVNENAPKVISGISNYLKETANAQVRSFQKGWEKSYLNPTGTFWSGGVREAYASDIARDKAMREQGLNFGQRVLADMTGAHREATIPNQLGALGMGVLRNVAGFGSWVTPSERHRAGFRSFLNQTNYDNPTLQRASQLGSIGHTGINLAAGFSNVANKVVPGGPLGGALGNLGPVATRIGPQQVNRLSQIGRNIGSNIPGRGWWNTGRNVRVPNENTARFFGKGSLFADDAAQVGKFTRDIPFDGIGPTQRVIESGLGKGYLAGIPKNFRQLGQLVQGKGGITWSGTRGVPTGPTALGRQTFERPVRFARDVLTSAPARIASDALRGVLNYTPATINAGLRAGITGSQVLPADVQAKMYSGLLNEGWTGDIAQGVLGWAEDREGVGSLYNKWKTDQEGKYTFGDLLERGEDKAQQLTREYISGQFEDRLLKPGAEAAQDLRGVRGWYARRQARLAGKELAEGDLTGLSDRLGMNVDLAERYGGEIPTAVQWAGGQFNRLLGKNPDGTIRSPDGTSRTRRERVRNLRESGYGTSRNNQMRIQSFDPNKINIQANPYGQSQAASEEAELAAFWQQQERLNTAADQRLKDIQSDQSNYSKLIEQLTGYQTGYTDELARIQPIGKGLEDELARIQPIGKEMSSELERIRPYGKQYADEIERLKPFDQMFRDEFRFGIAAPWDRTDRYGVRRSGDSWNKKGEYVSGGKSGREFIEQNMRWYSGTKTPETTKLLKDYQEYLTGVENLHKWQKEHEAHVGELETKYKDYQDYLGNIQTQQKEYQDYLSELQTEQSNLTSYSTEVSRRSKALDDYSALFQSARQASDEAARTYTIRSQQGISSGIKSGVSGIRAARGFSSYGGRNRNRSAKRRFNRDFRIGSFGDSARIQPINV